MVSKNFYKKKTFVINHASPMEFNGIRNHKIQKRVEIGTDVKKMIFLFIIAKMTENC